MPRVQIPIISRPRGAGKQARLVCVPAFGLTGEAALLDLETLECNPIRFASAVGVTASQDE